MLSTLILVLMSFCEMFPKAVFDTPGVEWESNGSRMGVEWESNGSKVVKDADHLSALMRSNSTSDLRLYPCVLAYLYMCHAAIRTDSSTYPSWEADVTAKGECNSMEHACK